MNQASPPLVPVDVDLRDFPYMPVDIGRLFGSAFHARSNDAEWRAGVTLWLKSFHQVPAASLPDDDIELARLAEFGRDTRTWRKLRAQALHGWVKAEDGRLYHPVVAEKALEAWIEKLGQRKSSEAGNAKRHNLPFDPSRLDNAIEASLEFLEALNPQSRALRKRTRREAASRTLGSHTEAEWKALLKHCGNRCCKCGSVGTVDKDHILPISSGGSDTIGNLQPLCPTCNSGKGRDATDFRPRDWPSCLPPGSLPTGDLYASTNFPSGSQERGKGREREIDKSQAQQLEPAGGGGAAPSLETRLREAAGLVESDSPALSDVQPIELLLAEGLDLDRDILPVIRSHPRRGRARSWGYFLDSITEHRRQGPATTERPCSNGTVWVAKDSPNGEEWDRYERARGGAVKWLLGKAGIGRALPSLWPPDHANHTETREVA